MSVSVIVPALNAADTLDPCLRAIKSSTRPPAEIIVFDDGSSDLSGAIAEAAGARVLRNDGKPFGPATARNQAVEVSTGNVLIFIDADVVVHADAIERLIAAVAQPGVVAGFGSYDNKPPARNLASLYMNLRHYHVHQQGAAKASTFWAGLGVIRRDAFLRVGGYSTSFTRPSIEDIELGTRLIAAGGGIRLVRAAQGAHWKKWTLGRLWRTDLFQRAIPWSRLIAERHLSALDLNASAGERRAAILAHGVLLALPALALTPFALLFAIPCWACYIAANRRIYQTFWASAPRRLILSLAGLQWMYHIYASQAFAWTLISVRLRQLLYRERLGEV